MFSNFNETISYTFLSESCLIFSESDDGEKGKVSIT